MSDMKAEVTMDSGTARDRNLYRYITFYITFFIMLEYIKIHNPGMSSDLLTKVALPESRSYNRFMHCKRHKFGWI